MDSLLLDGSAGLDENIEYLLLPLEILSGAEGGP